MPLSAHKSNIPNEELKTIARCFLPDIIAFFESEEGKREFDEWEQQKEKEEKSKHKMTA